jgi:amino acid adenylation domain-containing protein
MTEISAATMEAEEEVAAVERTGAPLSFAQERLWFLERLEPGTPVYNITRTYRLLGPLDASALRGGAREVEKRHAVLRTTFAVVDGEPVQEVSPEPRLEVPVADLSDRPEDARDEAVRRRLHEEVRRPFDLARGPLVRLALLRLAPDEHVLVFSAHHIVMDGWSEALFFRELEAFYVELVSGRRAALDEPAFQYADFAAWQRERMRGEPRERLLSFWRSRLEGAPPVLTLPTDFPRPPVLSHRGAAERFDVPAPLVLALRALARKERVSLFMPLLAAHAIVLSRWARQPELVIGCPVAGRDRPESEPLIGLFSNTLALRLSLQGDPTVSELLSHVRDVVLDAMDHQELPLEMLVSELAPQRTLSHAPLFQTMFGLQNVPRFARRFGPLAVESIDVVPVASKFDVSIFLVETASPVLEGIVEYATDLFRKDTARRLARHYLAVLSALAENPDRRVSELSMISPEDAELLARVNTTDAPLPETTVDRLVADQAAMRPDEPAVLSRSGAGLTYRELDEVSARLARLLAARGAGPGSVVALEMTRGPALVTALLGILRSGAAYFPLDPRHPKERLSRLLEDAGARLVVTERPLTEAIPPALEPLFVDALPSGPERAPDPPRPEDPAYVIATSGSTGMPKGVLLTHRGLVNVLLGTARLLGLGERDVFLATTPVTFDIASFELLAPLVLGARVAVAEKDEALDARALQRLVGETGATVLQATPSTWRLLVDLGFTGSRSLTLLSAGEALPRELAEDLLARGARLVNAYGPAETTIYSTVQVVEHGTGHVPIGRPLANTRIRVADPELAALPPGVPGELLIAGAGLARGYVGNEALTKERFVVPPGSHERFYRTGDLSTLRPDGALVFLGRLDDQVKVRGVRVELGEVEAALRGVPGVREAAAALFGSGPDARLVGFVAPRSAPPASELRRALLSRLPEHMVPSGFVPLDSLPKSRNGKLDRRALAEPAPARSAGGRAPESEVESRLAAIWSSVLGVPSVGREDDFFELGGHSLLAVRLFGKIERAFGRRLPLATIFQARNVASLAPLLVDERWQPSWSSLVPIQPEGAKTPLFCVHAVGGNVLTYADVARHLGKDQPVWGLQARGLDGVARVFDSVEEMARHYVAEIRGLLPDGPYHLGGSSAGGLVAYEMARQLREAGDDVGVVALFDTWGPDYPRSLGRVSPVRLRVQRLIGRVDLHVGNFFAAKGARAKVLYVTTKARRFGKDLAKKAQRAWRAFSRRFQSPALARVEKSTRRAVDLYVPGPYDGRITLFRATKQPAGIVPDRELGWSRIAHVDVVEVPGYHGAIVYEPRVGPLAAKLKELLDRSHEERARRSA